MNFYLKNYLFSHLLFFSVCFSYLFLFSCKQKKSRYIIGISQCSDDDWRHKMNTEMLREVALYQDVTLNINYQIGKEVGNYIVTMLQGKGKIAEIRGLEGSTPALERHNDA